MSKTLYIRPNSARIANTVSKLSEKKMNKSKSDAIDILKAVSCPPPDGEKLEKDVDSEEEETAKGSIRANAGAPPSTSSRVKEAQADGKQFYKPGTPGNPKASTSYKPSTKLNFTETTEKALKAASIVGMAKRARMQAFSAQVAQDQPLIGTNRTRNPHEPLVIPIRCVEAPVSKANYEVLTDCTTCGYVYKSLESCPCCDHTASIPTADFSQY